MSYNRSVWNLEPLEWTRNTNLPIGPTPVKTTTTGHFVSSGRFCGDVQGKWRKSARALDNTNRELTTLTGTMNTSQAKPTEHQIKTRYGGCGVWSHLDARKRCKIRVVLRVVPPSLLSTIAALVSLLESFTGLFLHSANRSGSCGSSFDVRR